MSTSDPGTSGPGRDPATAASDAAGDGPEGVTEPGLAPEVTLANGDVANGDPHHAHASAPAHHAPAQHAPAHHAPAAAHSSHAHAHDHGHHGHGHHEHHEEHIHERSHYAKVYGALVVLFFVSVIGPVFEIPVLTLITAFGVACVKAAMVVYFFMHLGIEKRFVHYFLVTSLVFMFLMFAGLAPDVMMHEGTNWVNASAERTVAEGLAAGSGHGDEHGAGGHDAPGHDAPEHAADPHAPAPAGGH